MAAECQASARWDYPGRDFPPPVSSMRPDGDRFAHSPVSLVMVLHRSVGGIRSADHCGWMVHEKLGGYGLPHR
ncbi:unnamed protein product [Victoria cruziana]